MIPDYPLLSFPTSWVCIAPLSVVLTWFVLRTVCSVANRRRWVDLPNERSIHKTPVPRLGGAVFVPIMLVLVWLFEPSETALRFISAATSVYVLGLLDDLKPIAAALRLFVQIAISLAFLSSVVSEAPLWVTGLLSIWIVGTTNVYNFMDGADGIAAVQAIVASITWGAVAFHQNEEFLFVVALSIGCTVMGFLFVNWHPARMFMGDAGSTVLGFTYATIPILVEPSEAISLASGLVIAASAIWPFLVDGVATILKRLFRGENIFAAHRSHCYQRLILYGWTHQRVAILFGAGAMVSGYAACMWVWEYISFSSVALVLIAVGTGVLSLGAMVRRVK